MAKGLSHRPSVITIRGSVAEVELRRGGGVAIVDASDVPLVSGLSWRKHVRTTGIYAVAKILGEDGKRHTVYMHRRIMGDMEQQVDHRDRDGLNNRRANMRPCTGAENSANRGPATGRALKGVYPADKKWVAKIGHSGIRYRSPRFATAAEAARWYDAKAVELHGNFARPNTPDAPLLDEGD
jgi:hypothetical protein